MLWRDVLRYFRIPSFCLFYPVELGTRGGEQTGKNGEKQEGSEEVKGLKCGKE